MAHIILREHPTEGSGAQQLIVNGQDLSFDTYHGVELVKVGDPEHPESQEIGLRITLVVETLEAEGSSISLTSFDDAAEAVQKSNDKAELA